MHFQQFGIPAVDFFDQVSDVNSGGEGFVAAADDNRPDPRVFVKSFGLAGQFPQHFFADGIKRFRTVQGNNADFSFNLADNGI